MNTLIANQYGRVQGEAGGGGLTLCVTAQTPRRESVELQTRVDSVEQPSICLRSCGPGKSRTGQQRIQDQLSELGIPDALIEATAKSDPQGLLVFDDLPGQPQPAASHADQTPTEQSST
jgi:hypothetical protein